MKAMNVTPLVNEAAPDFVDSTPILKAALTVAGLKRASAERRIEEETISKIPRIQEKVIESMPTSTREVVGSKKSR